MSTETGHHAPQGAPAALLNGLAIMETFTESRPSLSVTEISSKVGLHKSTVSRVLAGLADAGYVMRDQNSGKYQLGLSILSLAAPLLADLDPRVAALPYLEELTAASKETSALAMWSGKNAVVVEQVASPHQVKHTASIGTQYNLWESSSVRVILAHLPINQVEELIEQESIRIASSRPSPDELRTELEQVVSQGYAVNDGFTTPEEFGAAAPVYDLQGKIVGSIVVSAPTTRVELENKKSQLIEQVRQAAAATSTRLGRHTGQ